LELFPFNPRLCVVNRRRITATVLIFVIGTVNDLDEDGIKNVLKRKGMGMTQTKNWAKDLARWPALCKPSTLIGRKGCYQEEEEEVITTAIISFI
jgi:hypothetical protein